MSRRRCKTSTTTATKPTCSRSPPELRKEYELIVARGYLLQIDAPDVAMERACFFQTEDLGTFLGYVEMHIAAVNAALDNIPRDRVRFHACYGNRNSPHLFDVECPDILPLLYEVKVGALSCRLPTRATP